MNALLLVLLLQPSEDEMTRRRVEAAISSGGRFLERQVKGGIRPLSSEASRQDELVLYTLVHAGVDRNDAEFQTVLKATVEGPFDHVYNVALRAMALQAIDPTLYRPELTMCAQYLVDEQCADGRWGYGTVALMKRPADSNPDDKRGTKANVVIKRLAKGDGGTDGDNSNTQYALLGLRACVKAGLDIDAPVFEKAVAAWEKLQKADGGWGYGRESPNGSETYGSMTAGGISSLIIAKEALKKPWKDDAHIKKAIEWLNKNWAIKENAKHPDPQRWMHYYFYGLERVGDLMAGETIGQKKWYPDIRDYLLLSQKQAEGSWVGSDELKIADTCFAILFLRRATKPAVATK